MGWLTGMAEAYDKRAQYSPHTIQTHNPSPGVDRGFDSPNERVGIIITVLNARPDPGPVDGKILTISCTGHEITEV